MDYIAMLFTSTYTAVKNLFWAFFFYVKIPYKGKTKLTIETPELTIETFDYESSAVELTIKTGSKS